MPQETSILSRLHLQSLRHLEAVVRLKTFEAAARELNVTPGAVSQQIRRLETNLGVSLFRRYGNRSEPTEAAVQMSQTLRDAFTQIENALDVATGKSETRAVKIKIFQTWANRWLIPRLEAFGQKHPGIAVEFETGIESVDAGWSDLDLALSLRSEQSPSFRRYPLFTPHLCPVCTPAVALQIASASSIERVPLIASRNRMSDWQGWLAETDYLADEQKPLMVFSNSTLVYEAALAGNGVAIAQLELVLPDLAAGRLERPFPEVIMADEPISLLQPVARARRAAPNLFRDWLIAEAELLRQRTEAYLAASA